MIYEFEDVVTGERVEREYQMGAAPLIGDVVDGLRRVVSVPHASFPDFRCHHVAYQLDVNKYPDIPHRTPDGMHGAFHTTREIKEFQSKHPEWKFDR